MFVAAIAFGDPHIITFDGKAYTLQGIGDFVFLHTTGFRLQGRMKKSPWATGR